MLKSLNFKSIKKQSLRIGVDLMGGETPPRELATFLINYHQDLAQNIDLILYGTEDVFKDLDLGNMQACIVQEYITMQDDPLMSLRKKKNASIPLGIQAIRKKQLDAFVSTGNTGALMAAAKLMLKTLSGIKRPGLLTLVPTQAQPIAVVDVGANVGSSAEHLVQFALMGIAYQKTRGVPSPVVGLLNIGAEEKKGTKEVREAYQKLLKLNNNPKNPVFLGNVEGRGVFEGKVDVLVTDGFTGNVFLKTAEGVAGYILEEFEKMVQAGQAPPLFVHALSLMRRKLHYTEYPGAILCGVEGIVIKCHGDSTPEALLNGVKGAIQLAENHFLEEIKLELKSL